MRRPQAPLTSRAGRVAGRHPSEDGTSLRSDDDAISEATVGQALNAVRMAGKDWQKRVCENKRGVCGGSVCTSGCAGARLAAVGEGA